MRSSRLLWYSRLEYEASFLRLIEKVTNGCRVEIDETGTSLYYKPGLIIGGKVTHHCSPQRAIGYYLEGLLQLAPFGKDPLYATLSGITNHNDKLDVSVDAFRTVIVPTLAKFGLVDGVEFKILKRGAPPGGGFAVTIPLTPLLLVGKCYSGVLL